MDRIYTKLTVLLTVKETDEIIKDLVFLSCPPSRGTKKLLEKLENLQKEQFKELETERVKELERRKFTCP